MVTFRRPARRGASRVGCLLSLALFAGAVYYGVEVGRMYWRYNALVGEMRQVARFAQTTTDDAIRRTVLAKIEDLGLPAEARRVVVERTGPPWRILIRTEYQEPVPVPVGPPRHITFRPSVELRF
jgi:hypothetical protein